MLRNADGGVKFSRKKRYEGVRSNVISVTTGWVGVQFPGKKRYVTLEWPLVDSNGGQCRMYMAEVAHATGIAL